MPRRKVHAPETVGEVLTELAVLYRDARRGRIETLDASRLATILNILRQTPERYALEERICSLEKLVER